MSPIKEITRIKIIHMYRIINALKTQTKTTQK